MEKIIILKNRERIFLALCMFFVPLPFIFLLNISFGNYIVSVVFGIPFILLYLNFVNYIHRQDERYGVTYSNEGVTFFTFLLKKKTIAWKDLVINKRFSINGYLVEFRYKSIDNSTISKSQLIYWPNEESHMKLIRKYVPPTHELYSIGKSYAEKRGLSF